MGVLRLVLALSVVVTHTEQPLLGISFLGGAQAVQVFFIISGFYMAMILAEKYVGPGSYRAFIKNRVLRLLPTYWLVTVAAFAVSALLVAIGNRDSALAYFGRYAGEMDASARAFLILSNLLLLGQDAALYLHLTGEGALGFVRDYKASDPQLWHFMLSPQAWSIALELYFYALAPLVLRKRTRYIVALLAASLTLRAGMFWAGWYNDPWNYRFFPNELALFLAGALAYRGFARFRARIESLRWLPPAVAGAAVLGALFLPGPGGWTVATRWIFYGLVALALPLVFASTQRNRLDRLVGELSYPVYMWHWLVMTALAAAFGGGPYESLAVAIVTLVLAALTVRFLILPVERLRQAEPVAARSEKPRAVRPPQLQLPVPRPMRLAPQPVERRRPSR